MDRREVATRPSGGQWVRYAVKDQSISNRNSANLETEDYMSYKKMTPRNGTKVLNVLVIGRVSTPDQPISNIEAGFQYAEGCIKDVYEGEPCVKHLGEQASGMLVERETIMEAYELIERGWPDLVLMEDISKSYRNPRWIYAFVQDCFDAGVRVIAPGDGLDTWEDNWEVTLGAAALRHGLHIPDTRRRIRRTSDMAFPAGGMVMKVRPGYRKLTKEQADSGKFGAKGLRIMKDPEWTPIFQKLYEMVVKQRKSGTRLAVWLNSQVPAVPTGPYATRKTWNQKLILELLRDPLLYGLRQFRKVTGQMLFRTGKSRRRKNPEPQKIHVPELAHMTEGQWREMNQVLDELGRKANNRQKPGPEHPRHGVARYQSITPLQHATCAICGDYLYIAGYSAIKCKNALGHGLKQCWNRVQATCETSREALIDVVLEGVDRCPGTREALLEAAWRQIEAGRRRLGIETSDIEKEVRELETQADRIADAIAEGGNIKYLVAKAKTIDKQLKTARKRLQENAESEKAPVLPITQGEFEIEPRPAILELARTSFEFSDLMRTVVPHFIIQPIQALDTGQVHARAIFTFDPGALVQRPANNEVHPPTKTEIIERDLFEAPVHIRYVAAVVALRKSKLERGEKASLKILAQELNINRMTVKRALGYAKIMDQQEMTELYRVLREAPEDVPRWHKRNKGQGIQDQAA
jgi:DNA invertase Pin-like site-specific DNA recombinase